MKKMSILFVFIGNWPRLFMQVFSLADNLHEISMPLFWKNKKNISTLSSAEIVQRQVTVNAPCVSGYVQQTTNGALVRFNRRRHFMEIVF